MKEHGLEEWMENEMTAAENSLYRVLSEIGYKDKSGYIDAFAKLLPAYYYIGTLKVEG